jgi:hypothetical protein
MIASVGIMDILRRAVPVLINWNEKQRAEIIFYKKNKALKKLLGFFVKSAQIKKASAWEDAIYPWLSTL